MHTSSLQQALQGCRIVCQPPAVKTPVCSRWPAQLLNTPSCCCCLSKGVQPAALQVCRAAAVERVAGSQAKHSRIIAHCATPQAVQPLPQQELSFRNRHSLYDAQGRLMLKNLTLPELKEWCRATGTTLPMASKCVDNQ
eukprot:GHRR01023152.1.p1 GENE.GHRR01023152.1~~GHRR01023152.1.p1  ORF type:complete len:139 (+),score=41.53 GHRR01023152.1:260-676(+)